MGFKDIMYKFRMDIINSLEMSSYYKEKLDNEFQKFTEVLRNDFVPKPDFDREIKFKDNARQKIKQLNKEILDYKQRLRFFESNFKWEYKDNEPICPFCLYKLYNIGTNYKCNNCNIIMKVKKITPSNCSLGGVKNGND